MAVPDEPDPSAMVEPDLGASPLGEGVGGERSAAEMVDPVGRRLEGLACRSGRLVLLIGEPLGPALPNLGLLAWRLACDRRCDRPDLVLAQERSALQTVGLQKRSEDDRR